MSDEFDGLDATEKAGIGAALIRCRALAAKIANELEATMSRSGGEAQLTGFRGRAGKNLASGKPLIRSVE